MLPAGNRMRRSADFERAVRHGARAGRSCLVVHLASATTSDPEVTDRNGEPLPIVGFVVSKSVGNAVTRNRVKRRLRALSSDVVDDLPAGSALVVRALPASADATFEDLGEQLSSALRRARRGRAPHAGAAR